MTLAVFGDLCYVGPLVTLAVLGSLTMLCRPFGDLSHL